MKYLLVLWQIADGGTFVKRIKLGVKCCSERPSFKIHEFMKHFSQLKSSRDTQLKRNHYSLTDIFDVTKALDDQPIVTRSLWTAPGADK